jgi:hypothetical protein
MKTKMNNAIVLARSIQDNFLWSDKPFAIGQAWIDLLMLAEWKDEKVYDKGHLQVLHRGQVGRSVLWLSKRWGWSRGKTIRFLKTLENEKMCTTESTPNGTTITIENYNKYQLGQTTDDTTDETTDGQQTDNRRYTFKEVKEVKEYKKNIPTVYKKSDCQVIVDMYNEECPSLPKCTKLSPTRETHIKARLKDHSIDELRLAFQKAEASDFCTGRDGKSKRKWCNLAWMMQSEDNLLKVLEGNYDNKGSARDKTVSDMRNIVDGMTPDEYEDMERKFR